MLKAERAHLEYRTPIILDGDGCLILPYASASGSLREGSLKGPLLLAVISAQLSSS